VGNLGFIRDLKGFLDPFQSRGSWAQVRMFAGPKLASEADQKANAARNFPI